LGDALLRGGSRLSVAEETLGGEIMFKLIVHPGEILKDELDTLDVTLTEFARQIDVPPNRVSQIIAGKRSITGDTALRFGHWFGVDPQFWLNLQGQYDLAVADRQIGKAIRRLPTKDKMLADA
jgi:addiction module HigA family antidote